MTATRPLYEAVAKDIRKRVDDAAGEGAWYKAETFKQSDRRLIALLVLDLCVTFKADNSSFNKDRFVRACGFPELADN
jgi:hypothetical protein